MEVEGKRDVKLSDDVSPAPSNYKASLVKFVKLRLSRQIRQIKTLVKFVKFAEVY